MSISDELIAAYCQTNYSVSAADEFIIRIGQISEQAKKLLGDDSTRGAVFITAWNPFSQIQSDAENASANQALKTELLQMNLHVIDGYGSSLDANWREDSFFAYPVSKSTATALCCRYQQNAVVFVDSNGRAELLLHPDKK